MNKSMNVEQAMQLAIEEAYKGTPFVSPNPPVGCVVLDKNGNFLKAGHHEKFGGPHAEVHAVQGLSAEQLRGAHVIVTLEPCAHEGKTPSCAKMLAKLPIAQVTYGLVDPNPQVAGQGAQILVAAGIKVQIFSSADPDLDKEIKIQLEEVCEAFLKNFREKKIFVALKVASSLDGQIALKNGESKWITGERSREYVHYLRACYDAVITGSGTVSLDDPAMNIRHPEIKKENKVVVLDSEGKLLSNFADLRLAKTHSFRNLIWCVAAEMHAQLHANFKHMEECPLILSLKTQVSGEFDLEDLLSQLWDLGLRSAMIEAGGTTASAFLRAKIVDRLYLFQAPTLLGAGAEFPGPLSSGSTPCRQN